MTEQEKKALNYLLETINYSLSHKLVLESVIPESFKCGAKKYYEFVVKDSKKIEIFKTYSPYFAVPTAIELFFIQKHGYRLY